jgi:hypothetical protein
MIIHHTERNDAAQNDRTVRSNSRDMTVGVLMFTDATKYQTHSKEIVNLRAVSATKQGAEWM